MHYWNHLGFSAHVGEPIAADDTQAMENVAGYAVRNPLSLQRLVYLDGQQAVIYKGLKHNPTLGRNCRVGRWRGGPQASPWLYPPFPASCPFRRRRGSVSSAPSSNRT